MLLKNLIEKLQDLYDLEKENIEIMGEPEIFIDAFKSTVSDKATFTYEGVSPEIVIQRAGGTLLVLCCKTTFNG